MNSRLPVSLLIATAMTLVLVVAARAEDAPATIKFSDPAKPGRLEIKLGHGDLRITGADTAEISVKSEAKAVTKSPRKDGLRVISSSSSFVLSEKDNVVTLDAVADGWKGSGSASFSVTVPRRTAVVVKSQWGGDIACTGVAGNLELNSMNGTIKLEDIAGGVVASTMNGEIRANIRELREGSPLSFTSMNGEVVLRLPESARATVRLRTQNGSVLTDFDEAALVTKSETSPVPGRRTATYSRSSGGNKVISEEVHEAIREAVQTGASAAREAIAAVKESIEAAREGAEAARQDARREAQRSREAQESELPKSVLEEHKALFNRVHRLQVLEKELLAQFTPENLRVKDAQRQLAEATAAFDKLRAQYPQLATMPAPVVAPKPPSAPVPPKAPTIPTITGGKLVTGTLNGGGPEISVATMNGDVILRKLEAGK